MKQKGFTLAELLGVIVLLAIIALISFPPVIRQLQSAKDSVSTATMDVISNSAKLYLKESPDKYRFTKGDTYCVILQELVDAAYLKAPIQDAKTGEEIELNRAVKCQVGENKKVTYTLVKAKNCQEQIQ